MLAAAHEMNEQQFLFLQQLLTDRTGIRFRGRDHLAIKLSRRLRCLGLSDYDRYIALIRREPDELAHAIEAVTTNETFFFRDAIHFSALEQYMGKQFDAKREFRIWSTASSSGEEAYSIAMTVHAWAAARGLPLHTLKITGSDIDRSVLRHAVEGIYHRWQIERTPADYRTFLLRHLEQGGEDFFSIKPHIRSMVRFKRFNLTEPIPFIGTLDVIFCRNVFMYFSQDLRNEIFTGMHRALKPGGLLVMGLCEPLPASLLLGFTSMGHAMYVKTE